MRLLNDEPHACAIASRLKYGWADDHCQQLGASGDPELVGDSFHPAERSLRGQGRAQQPVLDKRGTHYLTDAAADSIDAHPLA